MWAFHEWEGYVYKNKSKQIFIHLHHPDILGSKERLCVCVHVCILCLDTANCNENSPPTGMKSSIHFPKDFQGLLIKS